MAGRKTNSKRKRKKTGRFFPGLVVEGLGFAVCFWLLYSVWSANGGNMAFFIGGTTKKVDSVPTSSTNLLDANISELQPIAKSWDSGWNHLRIRP